VDQFRKRQRATIPNREKDPLKGGLNLFPVDSDVSRSREECANSDVNHVTPEVPKLSKSAIATKINPDSSSLKPADKKQCRIQLPPLKYPSTTSKTSSYLHLPPTMDIPTQEDDDHRLNSLNKLFASDYLPESQALQKFVSFHLLD